ncbi:MAG TPA: protein kinase, partial [Actinomycetota bacterium]|nr:protein kinase [Actinomycetota bacterium]
MELGKDLAGRRLGGRYLLDREIEAGGMASVWKARDDVLGRDVAVKILHPDLGSDEEMYARFTREAVAAARLSHPAIVRVFDTGTDDGVCYIVMELVRGRTLADEIAEGPFEPARAAAVARGVLDALAHAHAAG